MTRYLPGLCGSVTNNRCASPFLLTAFKYLIAILAKAIGRDEGSVDDTAMATFLISFDCLILAGGFLCIFATVKMLQLDMNNRSCCTLILSEQCSQCCSCSFN